MTQEIIAANIYPQMLEKRRQYLQYMYLSTVRSHFFLFFFKKTPLQNAKFPCSEEGKKHININIISHILRTSGVVPLKLCEILIVSCAITAVGDCP